MNRVNDNQEARKELDGAVMTIGSVSALANLLGQMQLDDDCEPVEIGEEWRSPFYRGHLIHAIKVLSDDAAGAVEAVIEYLEQPIPIRKAAGE